MKKLAKSVLHQLRGSPPKKPFVFERQPRSSRDASEADLVRVTNVLAYGRTGEASYSGNLYPAGYHTLELNGRSLPGQRNPSWRLDRAPIDFRGKTILDVGCNQGGMLFALHDRIKWGVGIDFDPKLINAANLISRVNGSDRCDFYVFDLENDPLDLIEDFLPEMRVDVVLLLSVCMWIANWRAVINYARGISDAMLFETNGSVEQQRDQEDFLKSSYSRVDLLAAKSEDDPRKKERRLLFCSNDGRESMTSVSR